MNQEIHRKIITGELKLLSNTTIEELEKWMNLPIERKVGHPTKWTREKSLKIGEMMIKWMKNPENIYPNTFLANIGLSRKVFIELCNKYTELSNLYELAKNISEGKLVKGGLNNDFNPMFDKFILINHHNYKDKITTELEDNQSDNALKAWKRRQEKLNKEQ
jgi:hypothetical protein